MVFILIVLLLKFISLIAFSYIMFKYYPTLEDITLLFGICFFAVPLLEMMSMLGAIIAALGH